ncbi:hypothetical protein CPB83DRAFT_848013 [Crepidotus variabilis]|uniref:Ketoreductase (KR) domain-containing protein n=1 Tax=Crepidotus variabilis TaxID=179855 RepID=A0A9P6ENM5_9AGAR|nr:hypothetical protein CPB83DRAFT_848013 [Crepidotus variabilis]
MVLRILEVLYTSYWPKDYTVHIIIGLLAAYVLRTVAQGRKTNRERDLHARVVLMTGAFTPLGLTILQSLAQQGAHIIALCQEPVDSTHITLLIDILRTTTSNEQIYAEECDLKSPTSIRAFCTKFLTGKEQRLDAIIFGHEHRHIGSPWPFSNATIDRDQKERDSGSLASFLITTLLLPALLVAPVERDIRIINVVNPFYAAAGGLPFSPSFSYEIPAAQANSLFLREGQRSLRTIVLTRHIQRVLDALPTSSQIPKTEEGSSAVPIVSSKHQKSNITSVSVSPGIGRVDTISSFLSADWKSPKGFSYFGILLYIMLQPLFLMLLKSPYAAMQTVLHALYLPTPFKILAQTTVVSQNKEAQKSEGPIDVSELDMPEEVLLPGSLYAECASVKIDVKIPQEVLDKDQEDKDKRAEIKTRDKGKAKEKTPLQEEVLEIEDDGEYGGEVGGRLVWESYEQALKIWEKETPPTERDIEREQLDKEKKHSNPESPPPPVDIDQAYN